MEKGTRVRMTAALKAKLGGDSCRHVREFGACIGVVQGLVDFGKQKGPEVDVRWQPSNLRYGYLPEELEAVE